MNSSNKGLAIVLIILLIVCAALDIKFILIEILLRNKAGMMADEIYQKNKDTTFSLSKIYIYNGADAFDNSNTLQNFNISQYSDFALTINNYSKDEEGNVVNLTEKNTIKELYLDNFKVMVPSDIGESRELYYKNPNNIGKYRKLDYNIIKNKLNYEIIYKNENNNEESYSKPVFFTDCSNPITFGYINNNIYKNYAVEKNSSISYSGNVLNDIDVDIEDLTPRISFTIHLKNNLNEDFMCNVVIDTEFEDDNGSILSGYFIQIYENLDDEYKFFQL